MTDLPALIVAGSSSALTGLPPQVTQGAFRALGRLIGGFVEWPAAWIQGKVEAVEDENHRRRTISRAHTDAVAWKVSKDDALAQRTLDRMFNEEMRRQTNREEIARLCHDEFQMLGNDAPAVEPPPVSNDWLDRFVEHAGRIGDEMAQHLWAKVLTRETCKPGSLSVSTLEILARMDAGSADQFRSLLLHSFGNIIPKIEWMSGTDGTRLVLEAVSLGLVSPMEGLSVPLDAGDHGPLIGQSYAVVLSQPAVLPLDVYLLTEAGQQISEIVKPSREREVAVEVAHMLNLRAGTEVRIHEVLDGDIVGEGDLIIALPEKEVEK